MSPGLGRLSRFTDNVRPFWGGCSNASRMKSTDYHKLALVVAIALVDDRGIVPAPIGHHKAAGGPKIGKGIPQARI